MNINKENQVGAVVAQNYRTASVFKSHNIDFCCGGNQRIVDVCNTAKIDVDSLVDELNQALNNNEDSGADFKSWDPDLLADYIEKKHHRYVLKKIPELKSYLQKIVNVHGKRHPELIEVEQLFSDSAHELLAHMEKEEKILFPYVRETSAGSSKQDSPFGSIKNPIRMMMHEHDTEGTRFKKIAALTDNFTPPADACTTYRVAFAMLKEFEEDLHMHIHLENNILFPKAIQLEDRLLSYS